MLLSAVQELMPGTSAEHGSSAKGSSSSQLKSWLSGLGKKGKGELDEVHAPPGKASCLWRLSAAVGISAPRVMLEDDFGCLSRVL